MKTNEYHSKVEWEPVGIWPGVGGNREEMDSDLSADNY